LRPRVPVGGGAGFFPPAAGGFPDWVTALAAPSGDLPLVVADFKQSLYYRADIGICALADIIVENLQWGHFDPAESVYPGSGMTNASNEGNFTMNDDAYALVVSGTVVTVTTNVSGNSQADIELTALPSYAVDVAFSSSVESNTAYLKDWVGNIGVDLNASETDTFKLAGTYSAGRISCSAQGDDVVSIAVPDNFADRNALTGVPPTNGFIEQIILYPVQPDEDLPALAS
jgi:hypothetical protein